MAVVDELVAQVSNLALRDRLQRAVGDLRKRQKFDLVFEEHIPETTAIYGLPVEGGALAQRRQDSEGRLLFRVTRLLNGGKQAVIVNAEGAKGDEKTIAVTDLLVVKRFGEPMYAALTPLGVLRRGPKDRPYHAVINGENFHTLQLLAYLYEKSVDCIYIDPPYNTGARDWKYNNNFVDKNDAWRHSKWLSFMEKRLRLARRLLKNDGILVISIDENEHAHLLMLLEQSHLFPRHHATSVAIVHNPRGVQGDNFSYTNDFAIFVIPEKQKLIVQRIIEEEEQESSNLRNWGGESERKYAKTCFYPIYVKDGQIVGFGEVPAEDFHPASDVVERDGGVLEVWPIDTKGVERKWRYSRDSVVQVQHLLSVKQVGHQTQIHITKNFGSYRTVWQGKLHDASTHGTQLLAKFIGRGKFPFPKSLYTMREILHACTANRPNALIVDYFAGSGTTLHATMLLNQQIGGSRRCILVTNNEVEDSLSTDLHRKGIYKGDPRFEKHGIFEAVTKPRMLAAITGKRGGKKINGKYATGTAIGTGFKENVALFRLDYLDPDSIELGEQFQAVVQALWLAAGGVGDLDDLPENLVDYYVPKSSPFAVLFRVSRLSKFLTALEKRPDVTHVWIVTNSDEAYAEVCESLPHRIRKTSQLYRDYLRTFKVNAERR